MRVFNQMTECHRVVELAKLVSSLTGAEIDYVENPRKEAAENELYVENSHLLELGLDPIRLADDLLSEVTEIARNTRTVVTGPRSRAALSGSSARSLRHRRLSAAQPGPFDAFGEGVQIRHSGGARTPVIAARQG